MLSLLGQLARRIPYPRATVHKRALHPVVLFAGGRIARGLFRSHHDRSHVALACGVLVGAAALYVVAHVERAPVTGRRRLMLVPERELAEAEELFCELEGDQRAEWLSDGLDIVEQEWHPRVAQVERIVRTLVHSNMELAQLSERVHWHVALLEPRRTQGRELSDAERRDLARKANACVMPTGGIYVHAGLFEVARTDDELAAVLAHELAHVACSHTLEHASVAYGLLHASFSLAGLLGLEGFAAMAALKLARSLVDNAFSRTQEREADFVGLAFVRGAAPHFDERAALSVWHAFEEADKGSFSLLPPPFRSHPESARRIHNFEQWLDEHDLRAYASARHGYIDTNS